MRLVLPDRTATSFINKKRRASAFTRFIGFCQLWDTFKPSTRPGVIDTLGRGEVAVGHENKYISGAFCWEERDFALRGAVHFPLTARQAAPGFHERERAFLTFRRTDASARVGGPFHGCTTAIQDLGPARADWVAGEYPNNGAGHDLAIIDRLFVVTDVDVAIPGTTASGLRRVDITDVVQEWVERRRPNLGLVLRGDERFRRPGTLLGGTSTPDGGIIWERCLAIYSGFELTFAAIGETPPWGRTP